MHASMEVLSIPTTSHARASGSMLLHRTPVTPEHAGREPHPPAQSVQSFVQPIIVANDSCQGTTSAHNKDINDGKIAARRRRRRHSYHDAQTIQQVFFPTCQAPLKVDASSSSDGRAHAQSFFSAVKRSLTPDHSVPTNINNTRALQRPVAMRIAPPAVQRPTPTKIQPPPPQKLTLSLSSSSHPVVPKSISAVPAATTGNTQIRPATNEQGQLLNDPHAQMHLPSSTWNNVPRRRKKKRTPEQKYKMIKASWYHSVASKNRLGAITEDPVVLSDDDREAQRLKELKRGSWHFLSEHQREAKRALLRHLNETRGECQTPEFHNALEQLLSTYDASHFDPRSRRVAYVGSVLEGIGISAGKPTFPGCVGFNDHGDSMYKLGTMSFDMFLPTQLVMSVQGTFVLIDSVDATDMEKVKHVPSNLLEEVRLGNTPVRTYNIVTACTIEPYRNDFGEQSPNRGIQEPIRGVLTTYGYILPYPKGHRFAVWFTGGSLEVDGQRNEKWFQIFSKETVPKRTFIESGKVLAAKLLMGASTNDSVDENGRLSYTLNRPMASHIDLLYLDQRMQIFRGSSGTMYVHVRIPGSHAVQQCQESTDQLPTPRDPIGDDEDDDDSSTCSDEGRESWIKPADAGRTGQTDGNTTRPGLRRLNSGGGSSLPYGKPSQPVQTSLKGSSSYKTSKRSWYLKSDVM